MRIRAFALRKCFVAILFASFAGICVQASPSLAPSLFSVSSSSTRAVALESVSMRAEPFTLNGAANFYPADPRTRITVFCMNLDFLQGEGANALTADAEDASHNIYPLKVEYVGTVPNFAGVYMVVLRLNDLMTSNLGDVLLRLNLHGMGSNRVRVGIGTIGGGPADDSAPNPAPATPPGAATPLTLAQFQQQFGSPSFPSDQDRRRFLEQATWGVSDAELARVQSIGYVNWINDQFTQSPLFSSTQSNYPPADPYPTDTGTGCPQTDQTQRALCVRDHYSMFPLQVLLFQNAVGRQDQLRQRVAFALHQLIPVAGFDLNNQPAWVGPYLQALDRDAFGNFRSLLMDITLNPGMGEYLNMRGNSANGGFPNENYAREIMQLFSLGVDTLNSDGTPVLDAQGNRVPTYSQADITNLARVFTGWDLSPNKLWSVNGTTPVPNYTDQMILSNNTNRYDLNAKTIMGTNFGACTAVSPPCTTTAQKQAYKTAELSTAIDLLFNHQNTGPYVCMSLIHNLVTSNPSPAYVGRCAAAFANNGSNVRGDMKAVITEILLDPEARGDVKTAPDYGHLREPVLLVTNLLRTFNATTDGNISATGTREGLLIDMGQNVFNPPTVFSYYPADFGLAGTNLIGPEFGLLDTSTTYKRANFINTLFMANGGTGLPLNVAQDRPAGTPINYSAFQNILPPVGSGTPQDLVNALNTAMMHGTMSSAMNSSIVTAITAITNGNATTQAQQRTQTAIYLIATSSQYQVAR